MLASLSLALAFLGGFIWAVRSGQYEDTFTPSMRVLAEEDGLPPLDTRHSPPGGRVASEPVPGKLDFPDAGKDRDKRTEEDQPP
jgi:cbb3-type cytochrome oxidase maturation protein